MRFKDIRAGKKPPENHVPATPIPQRKYEIDDKGKRIPILLTGRKAVRAMKIHAW